jgi:hypothetical protein
MSLKNTHPLASAALVTLLALAQGTALAAENRAQRYTAGLGGSDMTNMLAPGWYGQIAMIHYHATKLKGNDGKGAVRSGVAPAGPALIPYTAPITDFRADAYVLLPRATYVSTQKILGGHVGFTVMLPLVERQSSIRGSASVSPAVQAGLALQQGAQQAQGTVNAVVAGVNNQIAANSGSALGVGDIELAPLLNWEIGDHQTVTFTPTVVFPTGEYSTARTVNPGFGSFYTFRPSVQYGFIGDGWDVGARMVLSVNSRNKDTGYRSGDMFNLDFAAMKFVTEDVRLGVQGYVVQQLTGDSSTNAATQADINAAGGNKMRAYALGPALAWIKNGGEMLMEGKILQEFGARNRAEGTTYMLTISKPFGL